MRKLPYRQIHMDFHTSPFIPDIGSQFDGSEFARALKNAHVESINLFAKCHHGFYYYPTKIGRMHPHLKINLLLEQIKACKAAGIQYQIYTCVGWAEDTADIHPEWMVVSPQGILGNKLPFQAKWRHLCQNNPEYRAYLKDEFREILSFTDPWGLWIDITFAVQCLCPACLSGMREKGLNPEAEEDRIRYGRMVEIDFMQDMSDHIKSISPDMEIYFNNHSYEPDSGEDKRLSTRVKRQYQTYLDIESLPSEMWGYTHFPIAVNFVNKYDKDITMMNGKFHSSWGDFGTLRNREALEYECLRAMVNGAGCCVGDQLHPSGKIDASVYQRIGEVYADIQAKEPWCRNSEKVAQLAVVTPYPTADSPSEDIRLAVEGVYRILSELHYTFDMIDFKDELDQYKAIILPDYVHLSPPMASKLKKYVRDGGKLLATAFSSFNEEKKCFDISDMGVIYLGKAPCAPRYIQITQEQFPRIPTMKYAAYKPGLSVTAKGCTAEILAYSVDSYFDRTYDHFCSHRQTPPKTEMTEEAAVILTRNTAYVAYPLFADYAENGCLVYKHIIGQLLKKLVRRPIVKGELPSDAEITLRKVENSYVLHILSYIIQRKAKRLDTIEERHILYDREMAICVDNKPKSVKLVPEGRPLKFKYYNGYASFVIPRIDGHCMVEIDMGGKIE